MSGLYNKYVVTKTDGTPTDPNAEYFVLRLDTDEAARYAAGHYADYIARRDPEFAKQLYGWLDDIERRIEIAKFGGEAKAVTTTTERLKTWIHDVDQFAQRTPADGMIVSDGELDQLTEIVNEIVAQDAIADKETDELRAALERARALVNEIECWMGPGEKCKSEKWMCPVCKLAAVLKAGRP